MKNKTVTKMLDSFDIYGDNANQFNLKGRFKIYSNVGVTCSSVQVIMFLILLAIKLTFVAYKENTNISVFEEYGQHETKKDAINLKDINF